MKSARELMLGYIGGSAEQSGALFADNGTLELPYLESIGFPPVMTGPRAITEFLSFLHGKLYPDFSFEDVNIHIETPEQAFAEYHINHKWVSRAKTSSSNFLGIWKRRTAKSSGSARRSTSSLRPKRFIRMASSTSSRINPEISHHQARMASFAVASLVAGIIFAAGVFDCFCKNFCPKPHTSDRSRDMIGSVVGTTTLLLALVLGLLIWTAFGVYTAQKAGLRSLVSGALQYDQALMEYRA